MEKDGTEKDPLLGKKVENGQTWSNIEPPPRAAHKVKRKVTVEPAVVGFFVACTAANPLNQQYLHARFSYELNYTKPLMIGNDTECGPNSNIEPDPLAQKVQSEVAFWTIVLMASDMIPALFMTILLGPYSDKAGRKKAMIPPLIGGTLRTCVGFIVVSFNLPLEFFLIGTLGEGLTGGPFTMMMSSLAYMADVTTKRQRPLHLLAIEIFSGLGTLAANVSVGYMIAGLGFKFPYIVILSIFFLTSVYVICFLPETVDKDPNAKLFTCENVKKGVNVITRKTENNRRWKIWMSMAIFFTIATVDFGGTEILTFFVLNPPLCWGSVLIGYLLSESYLVQTIGSVIFLKFAFPKIRECGVIIASCLSGVLYYFMLAAAKDNLMAFLGKFNYSSISEKKRQEVGGILKKLNLKTCTIHIRINGLR